MKLQEPSLPWRYSLHRPRLKVAPIFWVFASAIAFWYGVYWVATS